MQVVSSEQACSRDEQVDSSIEWPRPHPRVDGAHVEGVAESTAEDLAVRDIDRAQPRALRRS